MPNCTENVGRPRFCVLLSVHSLAFPDPAGAPWSSVGGEAVLSRRWDSSVTSLHVSCLKWGEALPRGSGGGVRENEVCEAPRHAFLLFQPLSQHPIPRPEMTSCWTPLVQAGLFPPARQSLGSAICQC